MSLTNQVGTWQHPSTPATIPMFLKKISTNSNSPEGQDSRDKIPTSFLSEPGQVLPKNWATCCCLQSLIRNCVEVQRFEVNIKNFNNIQEHLGGSTG